MPSPKNGRRTIRGVKTIDIAPFRLTRFAEGGSQHCQGDNLSLGVTHIYDWLQEEMAGQVRTSPATALRADAPHAQKAGGRFSVH